MPAAPEYRIRRLSYSALALFERCSYRFYAERIAGMRPARRTGEGEPALAATEVGDAVHGLLERIDLAAPGVPDDFESLVRARYPFATDAELERIRELTAAYAASELARRVAALPGAKAERPFAFEHDGVLFHGRIDVLHVGAGRALVIDYKTNVLDGRAPADVVDAEYHLQRLVYAIVCLRAGADEVEVVHQFLERADDVVSAPSPGLICRASRRSCPPRSRASRPAISARRPARWSARTARCWGSSARGPRCAATRASPPPR